jgi:hypothetical protein
MFHLSQSKMDSEYIVTPYGSPTHCPPGCVTLTTAMFANYLHARITTQQFTWFYIPLLVIFTCATHEPVHNNSCKPLLLSPPPPAYPTQNGVYSLKLQRKVALSKPISCLFLYLIIFFFPLYDNALIKMNNLLN